MRRISRELQIFSLSALDLFASAMGTFILIAVILFPYYLKNEVTVKQLKRQTAEIEALRKRVASAEAKAQAAAARAARAEAEARRLRRKVAQGAAKPKPRPKPTPTKPTKVRIPGVDIVYVIDTTSSMGEGVNQVRSSLAGVVRILQEMADDVRIGFVAYKARDGRQNEYVMIKRNLASTKGVGLTAARAWVSQLRPQGGGTEIMLEAMQAARGMTWRTDALNVIILVADEPGREGNLPALLSLARSFAGKRRRISAFLPPMRSMPGLQSRQIAMLQRQRNIVRQWMQQITKAAGGIFVPPEEGDLASTTLLTVRERMQP